MHEPKVSIIVPTYNSSSYLEGCLNSIKKQSYQNIELIIVDNNSRDNTKAIAQKYTDKVFNYGPERSAQRNYGVSESLGEFVCIIDSDMHLTENVITACVRACQSNHNTKAVVIPEESFGEGIWAQCKKLERSFYLGVDWMEAARFFSKKVFQDFRGYDEKNTGTEDYDLPQRIIQKYGKSSVGRVEEFILHNEQKISLLKTCRKKFYYAQRLDVYSSVAANKKNFIKQSNPIERYRLYFSQPHKLFKNPFLALVMLFMKTSEFLSGGLGLFKAKITRD